MNKYFSGYDTSNNYRHLLIINEHKDRLKSILIPQPSNYIINITGVCNFGCSYCFGVSKEKKEPLNPEIIYNMKYEFSKANSVSFSSIGEVMLNKNIFDYLTFVRKSSNDCNLSIATNGMIPTSNEQIDILHKTGTVVGLSLDTLRKDIQKILRPKVDVDTVLDFYNRFVERKKLFPDTKSQIGFNSVVTKDNISYLHELTEYASNTGAKFHFLVNMINSGNNMSFYNEHKIEKDDILNNVDNLERSLQISKENDIILSGTFSKKYLIDVGIDSICNKVLHGCLDPWFLAYIHYEGMVRLCAGPVLPHPTIKTLPFFGKLNHIKLNENLYEYVEQTIENKNLIISNDLLNKIYEWIDNTKIPEFFKIWNSPQALLLRSRLIQWKKEEENTACSECIKNNLNNMWTNCS